MGVFTTIPKFLTKSWTPAAVEVESMQRAATHSGAHAEAIALSIKIEVEFNTALLSDDRTFTEVDDKSESVVEVWKEARLIWADLEQAIETAVTNQTARMMKYAKDGRCNTFDALFKKTTTNRRHGPRREHPHHTAREYMEDGDDRTIVTLQPNDSASRIGTRAGKRMGSNTLRFMDFART